MIGQKNNINTLIQWRCNKSVPRFIILSGSEGSGRLTFAKIIIKMISAKGIIMGNSIADVRETIENAYTITEPTCYIFRNADDMKNEAKNALLKVVEEPPNNAYFIMTVQNIDNMLGTIKSRGTVIKMEPYTDDELRTICDDELILEYCNTPGQLNIDKNELQRVEDCADMVIKAFLNKSGVDVLRATSQIRSKQTESEKIDPRLFFRVFEKRFYRSFRLFALRIDILRHIADCKQQLSRNSINGKFNIEVMLLYILEELKNAEVSETLG